MNLMNRLRRMRSSFVGKPITKYNVLWNQHPISHHLSPYILVYTFHTGNDKERGGFPKCSSSRPHVLNNSFLVFLRFHTPAPLILFSFHVHLMIVMSPYPWHIPPIIVLPFPTQEVIELFMISFPYPSFRRDQTLAQIQRIRRRIALSFTRTW